MLPLGCVCAKENCGNIELNYLECTFLIIANSNLHRLFCHVSDLIARETAEQTTQVLLISYNTPIRKFQIDLYNYFIALYENDIDFI